MPQFVGVTVLRWINVDNGRCEGTAQLKAASGEMIALRPIRAAAFLVGQNYSAFTVAARDTKRAPTEFDAAAYDAVLAERQKATLY